MTPPPPPSFSLRVQFPKTWPGWNVPEYILHSSSPSSSSVTPPTRNARSPPRTVTIRVDPETESDYHSDTAVFRGYVNVRDMDMDKDGGAASLIDKSTYSSTRNSNLRSASTVPNVTLALKFAFRDDLSDDLASEAELYSTALKPLQGVSVPRCFGYFTCEGEDGQQISCLVLEYWGESLRVPFALLDFDVRVRILERLSDLHRCGLHHGDFAERNVLMRGDDVRLIDFDQSLYHDCPCDAMKINFDDFFKTKGKRGSKGKVNSKIPEDPDEFGCRELWEICVNELRIWDCEDEGWDED